MKEKIFGVLKRLKQWLAPAARAVKTAAAAVAHAVAVAALAAWRSIVWLWDVLYGYHYHLGVFVLRKVRRVVRFVARITRKPRHWLRYMWLVVIYRPVHRFLHRMWRLVCGLPHSFIEQWKETEKKKKKRKKKTAIDVVLWLPRSIFHWIKDYAEEWYSLGRFIGPIAGVVVLVTTIQLWTQTRFCLVLTYRDTELGIIENATVYDEGAAMARDRVIDENKTFTVDAVPTLTMVVRGAKSPLTASQVCDAILSNSFEEGQIKNAVGVYVEDEFVGAVEDGDALQAMLDELKTNSAPADTPSTDGGNTTGPVTLDQRIEFVQDIQTEAGLYHETALKSVQELRDLLAEEEVVKVEYIVQENDNLSSIAEAHGMSVDELQLINNITNVNELSIGQVLLVQRPRYFLQVVVVKTVREDGVTIPYKTSTVYRDDKYTDWKNVTKGTNGTKTVLTEIIMLDGYEVERAVVEEVVTQEPVTEIIEIGTKKKPTATRPNGSGGGSGGGSSSGNTDTSIKWVWPVPVCHRVYQGYHSGHKAIDISSGPVPVLGKPAVAAASGEVIEASVGWNGGYGNIVKVRHSNGLITVYAHLHSVKVSKGQKVSAGDTVGLIGNTGRSFGPHLHFEVVDKYGNRKNPLDYVQPKKTNTEQCVCVARCFLL